MKVGISIQKTRIEPKKRHFGYKYLILNLIFDNKILNFLKYNFKEII
jgi:hypothetical protein